MEVTVFMVHIREKCSWLMNSSSKRIHIRQNIAGNSTCIDSSAHGNCSSYIHHVMRIFFGQDMPRKTPEMITSHDVLEPSRQDEQRHFMRTRQKQECATLSEMLQNEIGS